MFKKIKQTLLLGLAIVPMAHAYTYKGIDVHGFFGQGYLDTSDNNYFGDTQDGSTHFTEAALNLSTWLNDKTRLGAQVYTYRLGDYGSMKDPMLDWAYLDYQHSEQLGLRVGRIKLPNGFYGEALDLDMSRPYVFLPQGVYKAAWRDFSSGIFGASAYGNISLGSNGSIDYNVLAGKVTIGPESAMMDTLSDSGVADLYRSNNKQTFAAQVIWNTPVSGLRLAASTAYANSLDFRGKFKTAAQLTAMPGPTSGFAAIAATIAGSDVFIDIPDAWNTTVGAEYLWKEWTFATEYNRFDADMYTTVQHAATAAVPTLNGTTPKKYNTDAFYVSAARRINDKLELGGYYSLYFANVDDRDGHNNAASGGLSYDAYQKDFALSLRYDITNNWLVKLEGHYINGVSQTDYDQNEPWYDLDDRWFMFALKTTYFF